MLIVSGKLYLKTGAMKKFLAASAQAVALARNSPGCRDFVVAEDPIEPDRVNVYEEWESGKALLMFRAAGQTVTCGRPYSAQRSFAMSFHPVALRSFAPNMADKREVYR